MVEASEPSKSRRGRPRGSCIADEPTLATAAELLLQNPGMKATTAFKRVIERIGDSHLRRLQVKWRADKPRLMTEARERADQRSVAEMKPVAARGTYGGTGYLPPMGGGIADYLLAQEQRMGDMIDPPVVRHMREQAERLRDLIDPPHLRHIRDLIDPPQLRHIREMNERMRGSVDSAGLRSIREQEQRMRDLVDPPELRWIRDAMDPFGRGRSGW